MRGIHTLHVTNSVAFSFIGCVTRYGGHFQRMCSVRVLISKNGADHYGDALFLLIISITMGVKRNE